MKNVLMMMVASVLLSSCATMFSGTSYTANINATEPGSEIYVDGKLKGTDEVTLRHKRRKEMQIEVKSGNETTEFEVLRTIKWGSQFANLLNWVSFIPVGTIVDIATGGIYQPEHKHVKEVEKVDNKTFNITIDNAKK